MNESGAEWRDVGEVCGTCGYSGDHLVVDGELVYCGRCKTKLPHALE